MYEQIFISALEFDDIQLADICLEKLTSQFSNSNRVKRLIGMRYEATGMAIFSMNALFIVLNSLVLFYFVDDYPNALNIYDAILKENPANLLVLKRKVTFLIFSPLSNLLFLHSLYFI